MWRRAGEAEEKLRRLRAVTDSALSSLELDEMLTELLDRTRDLLGADTAAIMLVDHASRELVATASSGLEEEVRRGIRVPIGRGFTGGIAARGEPATIDHVDHETVYSQILIDKHLAAMVGVPMQAGGQLIGVLHIGSLTPRQFTDDDVELLRLVADRAAMATRAQLSRLDRAATLALQRSLLPAHPPPIPGLQLATHYLPGAEVGVGGDWYDIFALPSGHVGIAIGDVAGSGLRAAVVMGRIRSALRAYALETDDPADVLCRLDRKIQLFEPDAMATVIYAVMAPDHARITLSVAGHLPPIMVMTNDTSVIDVPPDLPLGAYAHAPRRRTTIDFPAGSVLLFYTDGLVERREQLVTAGIERLAARLRVGAPDRVCTAALSLLDEDVASDDVAVLAVRALAENGNAG
jgi:serine phosphatase RsbU (regulator of sigma subunit)